MTEILIPAWLILLLFGFGYIFYMLVRDDIRKERKRKAEMLKQ
ncbi:hypothetical protein ACQRCN_01080 [Phascolarctobacterium succinatutens]